jgi:hypothetical protein
MNKNDEQDRRYISSGTGRERRKMTNMVDGIYYRGLAERDPIDVCKRTLCRYDDNKKCYTISAWGDAYGVFPHERRIDLLDETIQKPHDFFYLFIVYYLLKSKEIKTAGEWISEKDIPGGATFFRGPHEIPTRVISKRFGNDIEAFKKRGMALHGTALDMGDAAYRFDIVPGIPVLVLYWTGDDEFPPEAKILFDKSIYDQLTLDIIFALSVEICSRLGKV